MNFEFRKLNGDLSEANFSDLKTIAEGPIQLDNGWQGDRINYCSSQSIYIEFKSGPESAPGIVPTEAQEVTKEYVKSTYGVSGI